MSIHKMNGFSWSKIKNWKIGFSVYEVRVVKQLDPKYESMTAVCDNSAKTIFIAEYCLEHPDNFLESLFHELVHAIDNQYYGEEINHFGSPRDENFDELKTEVRSMSLLTFIADNIENFEYMIRYMKRRTSK